MNIDLLMCGVLLPLCFVASTSSKQPQNATTKRLPAPPRIRRLECVDSNLQRTLVWNSKNKTGQYQLKTYKVLFCVTSNCHYHDLRCYKDENRIVRIRNITETSCKTAVEQLLPYNYLTFKVWAIYRARDGSDRTAKSKEKSITCNPIEQKMALSAPTQAFTLKTTSIKVQSILPTALTNAVARCNNYDLDIRYYFCLHKEQEECEKREERCNSFYTFLSLEPGTKYIVESWYTSHTSYVLESAHRNATVLTRPDPFPVHHQIILVVCLSTLAIIIVVTIVVARFVRNMWRNWYQYIHDELPKFLEETKEELKGWKSGNEDLWNLQRRKFADDQLSIPPLRLKGSGEISEASTNHETKGESSERNRLYEPGRKDCSGAHMSSSTTGAVSVNNSMLSPPPYVTPLVDACCSSDSTIHSDSTANETPFSSYHKKSKMQFAKEMNYNMIPPTSGAHDFNSFASMSLPASGYDMKK